MTGKFLKCHCRQCGGGIEFEFSHQGEIVQCPHCNAPTELFLTPQSKRISSNTAPTYFRKLILGATLLIALGVTAVILAAHMRAEAAHQAELAVTRQTQQKFREAVAAVKVCTQGSTYSEFREKRLELETCYAANQAVLTDEADEFKRLSGWAKDTDVLWDWSNQYPGMELPSGGDTNTWIGEKWGAMLIINPQVATKAGYTSEQCRHDPDFYANNYTKRGLSLISVQCDELLTKIPTN